MRAVDRDGRRIRAIDLATRYGDVRVSAAGFVDASGDAALAWNAGLACREAADGPIYGTQNGGDRGNCGSAPAGPPEVAQRLKLKAKDYGLTRRERLCVRVPGKRHRAGQHDPCRDARSIRSK